MNLLFIDIETTGFSPRKHEVIELAAAIEINGVTQCEFILYFRPEKWENVSKEALAKNGWTVDRLKRLPEKIVSKSIFYTLLSRLSTIYDTGLKYHLVEHSINGCFDSKFLESLYPALYSCFIENKVINTRDLVKKRFPKEKNFTLKDCAKLLGIPFDGKRHHKEAMYDMQVMREIYRRCK